MGQPSVVETGAAGVDHAKLYMNHGRENHHYDGGERQRQDHFKQRESAACQILFESHHLLAPPVEPDCEEFPLELLFELLPLELLEFWDDDEALELSGLETGAAGSPTHRTRL